MASSCCVCRRCPFTLLAPRFCYCPIAAHIECNFKALHRGFDDLVEKLVKGYPNVRVIMIDPFWLQGLCRTRMPC